MVELLDVFYDKKNIMLVMELLSGGELFDRLSEQGPYTEEEAAVHVKSIASALKYLHSIGIIHRDLKPENLILVDKTADSALRVCDFGLSKLMDGDQATVEAEQVKTICGTSEDRRGAKHVVCVVCGVRCGAFCACCTACC